MDRSGGPSKESRSVAVGVSAAWPLGGAGGGWFVKSGPSQPPRQPAAVVGLLAASGSRQRRPGHANGHPSSRSCAASQTPAPNASQSRTCCKQACARSPPATLSTAPRRCSSTRRQWRRRLHARSVDLVASAVWPWGGAVRPRRRGRLSGGLAAPARPRQSCNVVACRCWLSGGQH